MNRVNIGKQIAEARKGLGKTQKQMAEETGIVNTTLSKIENGRFSGSLDIFEYYLDFVGLQLKVEPRQHTLPRWDEIESIFPEED